MIETDRLIIKPLSYQQLVKYIQVDPTLETDLQVNHTDRSIPPELQEALEQTILPHVADPSRNYLFHTLWTIILKSENRMVGDICFVGEPDERGAVEVGYGTYEAFQNRGIMSEALGGLIIWARRQPGVKVIIASTEKTNIASSAVLQKNGFIRCGESDNLVQWSR